MRFQVHTRQREAFVDITAQVAEAVSASGVTDGLAVVSCPHTTAGVTVNEAADPAVAADIIAALGRLVPRSGPWRHAEGNADAHVKASLMGCSVTVPVEGGALALGTWQGVFLCEFDGPRQRSLTVTLTPR